jgi:hypothetical protein
LQGEAIIKYTKGIEMKISSVANTEKHEVRFFEFISPAGLTVTSFFQVVAKPDFSLGCFDTLEAAMSQLENPISIEIACVEKPVSFFLGYDLDPA